MDARLRRLERLGVGDPEAKKRADRLRCKAEGCPDVSIMQTWWQADLKQMRQILYVTLSDERRYDLEIKDRTIIRNLPEAIKQISNFCQMLDICPRCDEPQDKAVEYWKELKKVLR